MEEGINEGRSATNQGNIKRDDVLTAVTTSDKSVCNNETSTGLLHHGSTTKGVKKASNRESSSTGTHISDTGRRNEPKTCFSTVAAGIRGLISCVSWFALGFLTLWPLVEWITCAVFWWRFAAVRGAAMGLECDLRAPLNRYFVVYTIMFVIFFS